MKISTERLKQLIREELAHAANADVLLEKGPQISAALQPVIDLYNEAAPEDKKQLEDNLIETFKNIVQSWRDERSESGY